MDPVSETREVEKGCVGRRSMTRRVGYYTQSQLDRAIVQLFWGVSRLGSGQEIGLWGRQQDSISIYLIVRGAPPPAKPVGPHPHGCQRSLRSRR